MSDDPQTVPAVASFTRGPVTVKELGEFGLVNIVGPDGKTPVAFTGVQLSLRSKLENEANAELIAEAFNVATETGLTPRQLAEALSSAWRDLLPDETPQLGDRYYDPVRRSWPLDELPPSNTKTASWKGWVTATWQRRVIPSVPDGNAGMAALLSENRLLAEQRNELLAEYKSLLARLKDASEACFQGGSQVAEELAHEMATFISPAIDNAEKQP